MVKWVCKCGKEYPTKYQAKLCHYDYVRVDEAGAATLSGLYNCEVCGLEKCATPGICEDCLAPPTDEEIKSWESN